MSEPAIRIEALTKDFAVGLRGWKLRAVDGVSLTVPDNCVYGLLGPNGCGKSTTMKIALGLLKPTHGRCAIYGVPSHRMASRHEVGFLPEAPYFYRYLTGRELVRFCGKLCGMKTGHVEERVGEVLELVDMSSAADRRVGTYSKGMLQRIGLAQALVHDPRLVILDEPTAGVDPVGSAAIAEIIRELKRRGKTVLLCSHLLAQVEGVCDEIAIMNRGCVKVAGRVEALLQRQEMRRFVVKHFPEEALARFEAWLDKQGAELVESGAPRRSLDELFLEHIGNDPKEYES